MSENKCPCCGQDGGVIHYPDYPDNMGSKWFCGNGDCSFSCNPEDLPRIAAAMEFTQWVAAQNYANGLSKSMIIQKAKEVFNG